MKESGFILGGCLLVVFKLLLLAVLIIGYVKDIIHLTRCDFEPSYKAEILYTVGAFTGLGSVFGYCDFGK